MLNFVLILEPNRMQSTFRKDSLVPTVHFVFSEKLENGRIPTDFGHVRMSILSRRDSRILVQEMDST